MNSGTKTADDHATGSVPCTAADGEVLASLDVPIGHPVFEGHFPGAPLLPGVLLLAEVMEALKAAPALSAALGPRPAVAAAKFLAPVRPGSALVVALRAAGAAAVAFEVRRRKDDMLAATGRLVPDGAMPEAAAA